MEPEDPPPPRSWALAWRLAAGQIVAWGILYYSFTVTVRPMEGDTGWSRNFLNLGLSLGLLAWGAASYPVGLWIQRRGARELMTVASLTGAAALALMASAHSPAVYLAAWLALGVSMAGTLYEPAFAVVTAAYGANYRRGITIITLVGGLASTVFIPIGQWAVGEFGWRTALLLLAAFELLVCGPLHWFTIPTWEPRPRDEPHPRDPVRPWTERLRADLADRRFIGLAIWFAAHSAAFTALIFQLVPLLQAWSVPAPAIAAAFACMGPMQVLGRLLLSAGGAFSSLNVGVGAMAAVLAGLLGLALLPHSTAWLCVVVSLFGFGNGMITIVRGTSIAELFGRSRYAELSGTLAAPGIFARAAAPLAAASIWTLTARPESVVWSALAVSLVGTACLFYVRRVNRLARVQA